MPGSRTALPYEEPGIVVILIQSCFLLALNIVNSVLDRLIYCGLIGQLLIGVAWGMPGANWLDSSSQHVIQQLGYLGLILLVYEGGLSTSFSQLKANFILSAVVALTGIGVPMALSFTLCSLVSATSLQAFSAGASLCSTSIGTTFTILSTTGLIKARLGVVLSGAAMMDDVAGLVMVQIISNLGDAGSGSSLKPVTVIRPIFVAIGFALGLVLFCRFVVTVALRRLQKSFIQFPSFFKSLRFLFVAHMCLLIAMVTGASYAGTSPLFASYLAGACISWLGDTLNEHGTNSDGAYACNRESIQSQLSETGNQNQLTEDGVNSQSAPSATHESGVPPRGEVAQITPFPSGEQVFERYCKQPLDRILKPLFFASIGFSIPITQMFHGRIVWRGVVYGLLMAFGKLITGVWLIRITLIPGSILEKVKSSLSPAVCVTRPRNSNKRRKKSKVQQRVKSPKKQRSARNKPQAHQNSCFEMQTEQELSQEQPQETRNSQNLQRQQSNLPVGPQVEQHRAATKPRSLYPASILGVAMVARGEIGYLIASLAETDGIFAQGGSSSTSEHGSSEMYLVVVWAITLCTIMGPICVGALVRRVQSLEGRRVHSGSENPLGIWGF